MGRTSRPLVGTARASIALAGASIGLFGCASSRHAPAVDPHVLATGRRIFVSAGCGGCHTLAAAGTHGTIGPNFDESETLSRAQIRNQLEVGVGGMPSFRGRLTPRQEAAVAAFLSWAMERRRP